ncbi:MAG: hypothetical protein IPH16_19735 [Haliscomenobacter sp.]|nr:hypothetical protein [Haliscomenobacter sp.]
MLCKDFEEPPPCASGGGLHEMNFQPNMIFDLRPQWKTFDDYLEAMSSEIPHPRTAGVQEIGRIAFQRIDLKPN